MFAECTNLRDLNAARIKACSEGMPLVEVNNAYNERRKQLMSSSNRYTNIDTVKVEINMPDTPLASLMYLGEGRTPGLIEITQKGIYA